MKKNLLSPLYLAALYVLTAIFFLAEAMRAESLNYMFSFVGYGGTFAQTDLRILGIPVYWFLMMTGAGINIWMLYRRKKAYALRMAEVCLLPIAFLAVSFAGGKLLYMLENPQSITNWEWNGLSLFGAIFLVPIAARLFAFLLKKDARPLLDLCAIQGLILLVCVRTGCFVSGCCGAFTMWLGEKPIILPIQLIEVAMDLVILQICFSMEKKKTGSGRLYPTLMLGYGAIRFVLQFFRKDAGGFPISFVLAFVCVGLGGAQLLYVIKTRKSCGAETAEKAEKSS